MIAAVAVMAAGVIAFGVMSWPVVASDTKVTPLGDRYAGYGVSFVYPFGFAVTESGVAGGAPTESSGEVHAMRLARDDSIVVRWGSAADFDGDLVVALDTAIDEVVAVWGPTIFHGRPLEVVVDGKSGIVENFSLSSTTNFAYGMVTVVPCAASDRLLTVIVVADTGKSIRRTLTGLVIPSAQC